MADGVGAWVALVRTRIKSLVEKRRAPGLAKGREVRIDRHARLWSGPREQLVIGARTRIEHGALLHTQGGSIHIGQGCFIGPYAVVYGHGGLVVGDNVMIAAHCVVVPSNHNFTELAVPINQQSTTDRGVRIEDNVWIGAHAVVLDGVTVGTGSIVAAGAVVTGDVPPGVVVAGVPARVLRARSEKSQIP